MAALFREHGSNVWFDREAADLLPQGFVCPKCGKATRVAHTVKDGKSVRVCRKCGAEL